MLTKKLEKYSVYFLNRIPTKRVTTGTLEIRLIVENKFVQRRPYRLSADEKL